MGPVLAEPRDHSSSHVTSREAAIILVYFFPGMSDGIPCGIDSARVEEPSGKNYKMKTKIRHVHFSRLTKGEIRKARAIEYWG